MGVSQGMLLLAGVLVAMGWMGGWWGRKVRGEGGWNGVDARSGHDNQYNQYSLSNLLCQVEQDHRLALRLQPLLEVCKSDKCSF